MRLNKNNCIERKDMKGGGIWVDHWVVRVDSKGCPAVWFNGRVIKVPKKFEGKKVNFKIVECGSK